MNDGTAARVFGPGHACGSVARLAWDAGALRVEIIDGTVLHAAPPALVVRAGGFGGDDIELAWNDNGQRWACHVARADVPALHGPAPAPARHALDAALGHARRHRRRHGYVWSLLIAGALVLCAVLIGAHNRILDGVATLIPPRVEAEIGDLLFARLAPTLTLEDRGAPFTAVRRYGSAIAPDAPFTYRFHVAADTAVNAFALPGGIIVVNRGLIDATKRPAELAGVLAHEVAHVELRHSLKGLLRASALGVLVMVVAGDADLAGAGSAARAILTLVHARADESAADAAGHARLVARGIDPSGLATFFATQATHAGAAPPAWLSTHPANADRAAALAALDAQTPAECCTALVYDGTWPPRD